MKRLSLAVCAAVALSITGCATSSYSVGKDFPSESVSKIVKGKTTGSEVVQMFGEPFTKAVISDTEEKWVYSYYSGTASAQSYLLTTKVETTGQNKMLDVLLKNGTVTNFAYSDSPMPVQYK